MLTKVVNLKTGEEWFYLLSPEESVICAFMQYEKHCFNTFAYDYTMAKVSNSGKTVSCGDFAALMGKRGIAK